MINASEIERYFMKIKFLILAFAILGINNLCALRVYNGLGRDIAIEAYQDIRLKGAPKGTTRLQESIILKAGQYSNNFYPHLIDVRIYGFGFVYDFEINLFSGFASPRDLNFLLKNQRFLKS